MKPNPQEQFARQICGLLDQGNSTLDSAIAERLRAARERALELRLRPVAIAESTVIVGAGGTAHTARLGHLGNMGQGGDEGMHPWRTLLVILMLLLGMTLTYYWNSFEQADENEIIDSALLTDDLPPKAYIDPGFQAWLSHYVQSAQSLQ